MIKRTLQTAAALVLFGGSNGPATAGGPVEGAVGGVRLDGALCKNLATDQIVNALIDGESWDCAAAGLVVRAEDPLRLVQLTTRLPQRRARLRGANPEPLDVFGSAVAMDGDVAIVGVPGDDDLGAGAGSATVFRFAGTTWVEEQALFGSDTSALDLFGQTVAIQGNLAVVGAPLASASGSAYVFRFDGSSWVEEQKLTASDVSALAQFGDRVVIDGDTVLVGAPSAALLGNFVGAVFVFEFDGVAWTERQKLLAGDPSQNQDFGQGLALQGNRALIGAPGDNDRVGAAYVFEFDGTEWIERHKLIASDGLSFDYFGTHLDLDGDVAVIGAWNADAPELGSGAAYVFDFEGVSWTEQQKFIDIAVSNGTNFGIGVALRGDLMVIGAPGQPPEGALYVYRYSDGTWNFRQLISPEDEGFSDGFGNAVTLSGEGAVVGSTQVNGESGVAYVYDLAPIGGQLGGAQPHQAACRNLETLDTVGAPVDQNTWDCEAVGFGADPGQRVLFVEFATAD